MLEIADPATGEKRVTFNPVWLKWFIDLASLLTVSGGGSGSLGVTGPAGAIDGHIAVFDGPTGARIRDGGPPGGAGTFVDSETPAGTINGVNAVFTLAVAPSPASSLFLFHSDGSPFI